MINIIKEYYDLNLRYRGLKDRRDILNADIKNWMVNDLDENYIIIEDYALRIQVSNKISYNQNELIEYLKSNGINDIIETKEVVNIDKLNEMIDNGIIDINDISEYQNKKNTKYLFIAKTENVSDLSKYYKLDM